MRVTARTLPRRLGPPPFRTMVAERAPQVGACLGLGWTEYGGDVMTIEASVLPGQGQLVLTGKMGEVMRESAHAGFSYVRARARDLGIDPLFYQRCDVHVHVLEGAVPKEGPPAGVTMATAMVSALTGVPLRSDVALSGEITLRGRVLPVGGIREKALAAQRAGVRVLVLPAGNRREVAELPASLRRRRGPAGSKGDAPSRWYPSGRCATPAGGTSHAVSRTRRSWRSSDGRTGWPSGPGPTWPGGGAGCWPWSGRGN